MGGRAHGVGKEFAYDEALAFLRSALVESAGNARAFERRAGGRPTQLSPRAWRELSEIELQLTNVLENVIRSELRETPWNGWLRLRAQALGCRGALGAEQRLIQRVHRRCVDAPLEQWRDARPQLEGVLWPFFVDRTQYLANTLALALDEPAPYRPLIWHPGRREFTRSRPRGA
ncbi:MAG: hypothetical protein ACE5FG_03095 [Myxococcota bacterium]